MFTTFQHRNKSTNGGSVTTPRLRYKSPNSSTSDTASHRMPATSGRFAGRMTANNAQLNYATGLLHVVLAGASGWALHECSADRSPIAIGCFGFLLGHSLLGILRYTHPYVQESVRHCYQHTQLLAQIGPITMITAQVSRHLGQPVHNAYAYGLIALVPTVCELLLPEQNERALDLIVLGTSTSLGYMGLMWERYWTTGLAVLTVLNHFAYRPVAAQFDVPRTDLITLGLGFFTVFAVNCVLEAT